MKNVRCHFTPVSLRDNIPKPNREGSRKTIYSVNGDSYVGEWKDDKKHGRGIQKWKATQFIYEGDWHNGKRCGVGVLAVIGRGGSHTKIYSGLWKDDKRHGYGENWYNCREFYEGEWFAGKRSGWGRQYYKDGSMYEGEWLDDKRCGNGMLRLPNENRYEGGWVDDMKNGKGRFIFHSMNQVMEGVWIDDIAKLSQITDIGPRQLTTKSTYPIPTLEIDNLYTLWRESVEENVQILRKRYPTFFD